MLRVERVLISHKGDDCTSTYRVAEGSFTQSRIDTEGAPAEDEAVRSEHRLCGLRHRNFADCAQDGGETLGPSLEQELSARQILFVFSPAKFVSSYLAQLARTQDDYHRLGIHRVLQILRAISQPPP